MAIGRGTAVSAGTGGLSSTLTIPSVTCSGADRYLEITVGFAGNGASAALSSGVFNTSEALTLVDSRNSGSGSTACRIEKWALVAPSATTADVDLTFVGSTIAAGVAQPFTGVDQSTPSDATVKANGVNTAPTIGTTLTWGGGDDELQIDLVWRNSSYTLTADGGVTLQSQTQSGSGSSHCGVARLSDTDTETGKVIGALSTSTGWAIVSHNLNAAASGAISGTGTLPLSLGLTGAGTVAVQGAGTLPLSLGLAGAGTVAVQGTGTLALSLGLAGAGTVDVQGAGTLPLTLGLSGAGVVGSAPVSGTGVLALTLGLTGTGTVPRTGAGTLPLTLGLSGTGTVAVFGTGTLPLSLGLSGTGAVGSVPIAGTGTLTLSLGLTGAGTVLVSGGGTLPLVLGLSGAGTVPRTGTGTLALVLDFSGAGTVTTGAPYAGMIRLTTARGPSLALYPGEGPSNRFTPSPLSS